MPPDSTGLLPSGDGALAEIIRTNAPGQAECSWRPTDAGGDFVEQYTYTIRWLGGGSGTDCVPVQEVHYSWTVLGASQPAASRRAARASSVVPMVQGSNRIQRQRRGTVEVRASE